MKLRGADASGFTLVEVMVSLTILSLVMLATITGLRTLASTQVAIERVTERVDEVRTLSSFLRDTFETIAPGSGSGGLSQGGSGRDTTFFRVEPGSVEWKAAVLFGETYGGRYFLRVAREENTLVLRWLERDSRARPADWERAPSRVLLGELEDFKVSYRREWAGNWKDRWDGQEVPLLLKMEIKASGRFWPELVFRLL